MNVVIFNNDGSIKNLIFDQIIVQGNNGADRIYCAIEGYSSDQYTLEAVFELPNGDITSLAGVAQPSIEVDGSTYDGFKIALTSRETAIPGIVRMSLRASSQYLDRQYTVQVNLTINESGYSPEYTDITMSQYENLLSMLSTYQVKYVLNNARFYQNLEAAEADVENLAIYQCVIVADIMHPLDAVKVYYKNAEGELAYLRNLGRNIVSMTPELSLEQPAGNVYEFLVRFDDGSTLRTGGFLCPVGPMGLTGPAAGFAAPTVSATTTTVSPTSPASVAASVSARGEDTEKVFDFGFQFYIPRGADGVVTPLSGFVGFQIVDGDLIATSPDGNPADYLSINSNGELIYTY